MDSLFAQPQKKPLADRMRPTRLSDFVGQETAVGERSPLRRMIEKDQLQSVLFYGPPGTGKTTLAQVIAHMTGDEFVAINAVSSGVPELRKLIAKAQELQRGGMGRTIVFIDEIHRFNKAQQDVLLPYVENGTIILIGATTENPFFEINSPLLSRMKVIRLEHLTADGIKKILERALTDKEKGYGSEGEDVRFIARRIVICAAEDVGNADPQALVVANAAAQAAHFVGLPEAQIPLAQAVCYIANAPKSNSCYMGIFNARQEVRSINTRVPKHLRDAHYPGAKQFGNGLGYKYPHDYPGGWVEQQYLPDELVGHKYYYPKDIGEESRLLKKKNEKD